MALAGKENDIDDSGGWYDESAADSTTENTCINEHGPDEMSRSDSLTGTLLVRHVFCGMLSRDPENEYHHHYTSSLPLSSSSGIN